MKKSILIFHMLIALVWSAQLNAQTITNLVYNGSIGSKKNLVIIGDGYTSSDQAQYNSFVNNLIIDDMFTRDLFGETRDAFNIYRINVSSAQSGVTRVDANGNVTIPRNTALDYRFSGIWDRCWMEYGPNTASRLHNILSTVAPWYDYVFIVLNESGFGGCAGGNRLAITSGVNWAVAAHEMGHMVGGLADEYFDCSESCSGCGEPGAVNVTNNSNRYTVKWKEFIHPSTTTSTAASCGASAPAGMDPDEDVSIFRGAQYVNNKYRPVHNCRMNGNSPQFCPVCYNKMQQSLKPYRSYNFNNTYTGDFNGDGLDDVLVHYGNSISIYRSKGQSMEHLFSVNVILTDGPSSWQFTSGDRFYVGDFNNDGKDDLFVFNGTNWSTPYLAMLRSTGNGFQVVQRYDSSLPGWTMKPGDRFYVGDFTGDDREEVVVVNTVNWGVRYLCMFRSTGSSLSYLMRYDNYLGSPSWTMQRNDEFHVGDFNGDGRDDLYVTNLVDWGPEYVGMIRSNGTSFSRVSTFSDYLPGWTMRSGDQHFVGDFNGDGKDDLFVFNGTNWSTEYLLMVRSTGSGLSYVTRYDNSIPGWNMENNDQYLVGDFNGDGRDDLYVFNHNNWSTEYLGMARSTGTGLTASWQSNWIGSWNLGPSDKLLVGNFNGGGGWDDIIIRNSSWFGLLRSNSSSLSETFICPNYIRDFNYHQYGWW